MKHHHHPNDKMQNELVEDLGSVTLSKRRIIKERIEQKNYKEEEKISKMFLMVKKKKN